MARDVFNEVEFATVVEVAEAMRGEARAAASTQEAWAMRAVVTLTGECDGAITDDGVGFNKSDTNAGRYLGHYIAAGGKLDDVEWQHAIEMLVKYHGQIGTCPRPDAQDEARAARVAALSEDDGFRARLKAVHTEAKRIQKDADRRLRKLTERLLRPEVSIRRVDEMWVVTTPYNEDAVGAWRALHAAHGGRWDGDRRARLVPYKAARALHALLNEHHAGDIAKGPKGTYVIGSDVPPFEVTKENAEIFAQAVLAIEEDDESTESEPAPAVPVEPVPAPVATLPAAPAPVDPYEAILAQARRRR